MHLGSFLVSRLEGRFLVNGVHQLTPKYKTNAYDSEQIHIKIVEYLAGIRLAVIRTPKVGD